MLINTNELRAKLNGGFTMKDFGMAVESGKIILFMEKEDLESIEELMHPDNGTNSVQLDCDVPSVVLSRDLADDIIKKYIISYYPDFTKGKDGYYDYDFYADLDANLTIIKNLYLYVRYEDGDGESFVIPLDWESGKKAFKALGKTVNLKRATV